SSPDADPLYAHGRWNGRILNARRGRGGFGYDPVFWDPDVGLAAAELTPTQKNARSHRGQSLRKLVSLLAKS
ncbi:MAG: non-canonical purine NTP pyrophosphatase, partial [Pseudomonadales bacterium]